MAVAEHQSAGRGRLGRRWEAPRGANLLFSILLRPTFEIDAFYLCGAVVGLAALSVCRRVGVHAGLGLKWPNDIVVDGRKLAGVLVEVAAGGKGASGDAAVVVVGLGLNVQWPPPDALDRERRRP